MNRVVIVGAGLAGVSAAFGLRDAGFDGDITLLNAEACFPYDRPQLSKEFLRAGPRPRPKALRSQREFLDAGIAVLTAEATSIDAQSRLVHCGETLSLAWDRLVLATGGRARRLPGVDYPSYHYLRSYEDALQLRALLGQSRKVVCIGGGVIGLELASAARDAGCQVDIVEPRQHLLARAGCPELSSAVEELVGANSVRLHLGQAIQAFAPDRVTLDDGSAIQGDLFLVGIGIERELALASSGGVATATGIIVDDWGQTSQPGIFAAGEVAEYPGPDGKLRLAESWKHALDHGTHIGRSLAGERRPYLPSDWVWSDQFGVNLQFAGDLSQARAKRVRRGDPGSDRYATFILDTENRIAGAWGWNAGSEISAALRFMARGVQVDPVQLGDPSVALNALYRKMQSAG